MLFEELKNRYGTHIARRVQQELAASEFDGVAFAELPVYLEQRAEAAHRDYKNGLEKSPPLGSAALDALYRRWSGAEDLSYLVAVAENIHARPRLAGE